MSNWIASGGLAPHQSSNAYPQKNLKNHSAVQAAGRWRTPLRITCAAFLMAAVSPLAYARDRGHFANSTPEMKAWFDGLPSGQGPRCPDAYGGAVSSAE